MNSGNVMTGRSTTRLHAPPGGKSSAGSIIFGSAEPATQPAPAVSSAREPAPQRAPVANKASFEQAHAVPAEPVMNKSGVSSNSYASGSNMVRALPI